jgi:hypothetical protein
MARWDSRALLSCLVHMGPPVMLTALAMSRTLTAWEAGGGVAGEGGVEALDGAPSGAEGWVAGRGLLPALLWLTPGRSSGRSDGGA